MTSSRSDEGEREVVHDGIFAWADLRRWWGWFGWTLTIGLLFGGTTTPAIITNAWAQDIDRAVRAYNDDKYGEAAMLFFEVARDAENEDDRYRAEYYLGQSLYRAGYTWGAFPYYLAVFEQGPEHPFFLRATEGLLDIQGRSEDDTLVPNAISDGYVPEFRELSPERVNSVNYAVGLLAQRKGDAEEARLFLKEVAAGAEEYPKARYLLALTSLEEAGPRSIERFDDAIEYFSELVGLLEKRGDDSDKKLYRLALLGIARTHYAQGAYSKSIAGYGRIPRFSDDWYDAMFESGWAYRQNALDQATRRGFERELGKALGMIHSVQSPYFDDRHRPESFVLKATAYFDICHFDRARKTLEDFFSIYEPMAEQLKAFLGGGRGYAELVDAILNGDHRLAPVIRKRIATNPRFQRFLDQLRAAQGELGRARSGIPDGGFKDEFVSVLAGQLENRVGLAGYLVEQQLRRESAFLEDFLNQARIIKFETADAERKTLEAGQDLEKGPRSRGPRPPVPNARRQYWGFNGEYWVDELGYYQYSVRSECLGREND